MEDVFAGSIRQVVQNHGNSLAYLSLTGKIEDHFRDLLTLQLHAYLDEKEAVRELNQTDSPLSRIDVAVTEEDQISEAIEIKQMFSYDALQGLDQKNRALGLEKDRKALEEAGEEVNGYVMMLNINHLDTVSDKIPEGTMDTYSTDIDWKIRKHEPEELKEEVKKKFQETPVYQKTTEVYTEDFKLGKANGVEVEMTCWLRKV